MSSSSPLSVRRLGFALLAALAGSACSALHANEPTAPLKPERTELDPRELADLVNNVLLVPRPTSHLPHGGRPTRTLHGQVVDHRGEPIVGAVVAITSPTSGNYGDDFLENYDKTDELGRFIVQDVDRRGKIVVRRAPGVTWRAPIAPEQEFLRITWPAPSRVRVVIAPELHVADAHVFLQLYGKRAGVSASRIGPVAIDSEGAATFDDVPPGEFRVFSPRRLRQERGRDVYAEREFGRFVVEPGKEKEVRFDAAARVPVRGGAGPDGSCVVIEREPTCRSDAAGFVAGELVGDDGQFLAFVPGPGIYRLTVMARPLPMIDGQPQGRVYMNGVVLRRRFVVDAATKEIQIALTDEVPPTVAFVHNTLDSEMNNDGQVEVSYSLTDVQAAHLVRHKDRAGVVAELLRILNDPNSPRRWEHVTLQALGNMTESPGVVDGLLAMLQCPDPEFNRNAVIEALHRAKTDRPRIVEQIAALSRDEQQGVRSAVCYYLGRMAFEHPELGDQVAPILIAGLTDSFDRTRQDSAATLGWLKFKAATPALTPLLQDANPKVCLAAARAVWQTSDNVEPLLTLAGEILRQDNQDYELKKDAAYALKGVPKLPTATLGALMSYSRNPKRGPPFNDHAESMRYQLGRVAQDVLNEYVKIGAGDE